jgi:type IV secretion system protein VirB3
MAQPAEPASNREGLIMADLVVEERVAGYFAPVHRSLTEPILLAGAPRAFAILNGTISAALGLGLRLWLAGLVLWLVAHMAAVWAAKRDPDFVEVARRHVRYPAHFGA